MYRWILGLCACVALVSACLAVTDSSPSTTRSLAIIDSAAGTVPGRDPAAQPADAALTELPSTKGDAKQPATSGDVKTNTTKASTHRERIVAYYGVAGNSQLGVVGTGSPDQIATAVTRRAAGYRGYGEPVRPAIELVATMAQTSPGRNGTYSTFVPASTIRRYIAAAHRHHILLVLDLQPGRASFLTQARALQPFLLDPSVALGLDTEWRITWGAPGGGRVGSTSASEINSVGSYLSKLTQAHHLPEKMMLIHQFRLSMLPDRSRITQHRGVWVVLHDDGFGLPTDKIKAFERLRFPTSPFGVGFKVFLHREPHRMTPRQVMALNPRPDVVTYQ